MTVDADSSASDTNKASPGKHEDKGGAGLGAVSILTEDDRKSYKVEDGLDEVELSDLSKRLQKRVRDVLRPFKDMWTGALGSVKVTQSRTELKPDSKPFFRQPYRASPKAREVKKSTKCSMPMSSSEPRQNGQVRWCWYRN